MTDASVQVERPRFTVVSAVYNVARYLDDYIKSIEAQKYPKELLQVVAVDDGSTDDSLERLHRWQQESELDIVVLTKENGGQGSARNLGLEHATGDWVTFTDPDDTLNRPYFARVAAFLGEHPETDMVATRLMVHDDRTGSITNTHPLRASFRDGTVLRHLEQYGDFFAGSAPSALFRTERLRALGVRFDDRVRPNFEDGHFCVRYLLAAPDPVVGFIRGAEYNYRRRSDGSSTLQNSMQDTRRFTDVPRYGYLDVIEKALAAYGRIPRWLQTYLTYELSWYVSSGLQRGMATACHGEVADQYHAMAKEILAHLDEEVVATFSRRPLERLWRNILTHSYDDQPWHEDRAVIAEIDREANLALLTYHFVGEPPAEEVATRGMVLAPRLAKTRDIVLFDRVAMRERRFWVPLDGTLHLTLDGRQIPIEAREPSPAPTALLPGEVSAAWREPTPAPPLPEAQEKLLRQARSRRALRRYRDAWVFVDRFHNADDSAEHLFHHVVANHPEINAWFVVEEDTPDWKRLKKAGVKRLVAYKSEQWKLLMINAKHLISSHADFPTVHPVGVDFPAARNWRFHFLQHGVIKDDLSHWLNQRPLSTFVTSTRAEYESVVRDGSHYIYTAKEVALTGLPRFDRLREAGLAVPPERRDLVLLVPTWRTWLVAPLAGVGSQRRGRMGAKFFESEFLAQWRALLESPELRETCEKHGLKLAFLPHPNLQSALPDLDLPDWVEPISYDGTDVRMLFARSAVLVTDYSSVAFNAAYIDRPVVYFQFDAERMFSGEHVGQGGYFDYRRDGFGPVTETVEETVTEVATSLAAGRSPQEPYASRIEDTFPQRDGGCCERTFQAILATTAKVVSKDLARETSA